MIINKLLLYRFFGGMIVSLLLTVAPSQVFAQEDFFKDASPQKVTEFTLTMLVTLDYIYSASDTKKIQAYAKKGDFVYVMKELLDQNKDLQRGVSLMKPYVSKPNEVLKLVSSSIITGTAQIEDANNKFVKVLRNFHTLVQSPNAMGEIDFATAKFLSDKKQGFILIATGAPQVLTLMWEPAKHESPTGKIPWRITREQRGLILKEIDRRFSNNLALFRKQLDERTGSYDAILFVVHTIESKLKVETYEQAKALETK